MVSIYAMHLSVKIKEMNILVILKLHQKVHVGIQQIDITLIYQQLNFSVLLQNEIIIHSLLYRF